MTPDDRADAAAPPRTDARTAKGVDRPSTARRVAFWGGSFAAAYGLSLFVLVDGWFLLAMPGIIGTVVLGALAGTAVLNVRVPVPAPYPTDGSGGQASVRYLRSATLKRYPVLPALAAVSVTTVVLMKSDYLVPIAPPTAMLFVFGTYTLLGRLVALRRCAQVLKVYPFALQERVAVLNRASGGRGQVLRLGRGDEKSPKLLGRKVGGAETDWPRNLAGGAWFAGDELFGGVLLVPGSGEVVWVQPNDGPALHSARQAAGPERRDRAKRAGVGGSVQ